MISIRRLSIEEWQETLTGVSAMTSIEDRQECNKPSDKFQRESGG